MLELTNDESGWILTIASSLMCILGCSVVFMDLVWNTCVTLVGRPVLCFHLKDNPKLLASSLSLSSGVLIFTSMYKLLPSAMGYFDDAIESGRTKQGILMATYILGILVCSLFNAIIHTLTSKSIVHHSHSPDFGGDSAESTTPSENTPLMSHSASSTKSKASKLHESFIDFTDRKLRGRRSIGKCLGYSECQEPTECPNHCEQEEDMVGIENTASLSESTARSDDVEEVQEEEHHHHHVSTQHSHMLSIGLQTALALTLHKLPEGFLTFATTHADQRLGFNVFVALAIHNFAEGFSMAFPLFLAFGSRTKAFWSAAALGGLSQPIGAAIAFFLYREDSARMNSQVALGLLICFTAGFMSIIGFQMYGTALTYGKSHKITLIWVFIGISIIGFSYCLTA